jgi:hypothetical protein
MVKRASPLVELFHPPRIDIEPDNPKPRFARAERERQADIAEPDNPDYRPSIYKSGDEQVYVQLWCCFPPMCDVKGHDRTPEQCRAAVNGIRSDADVIFMFAIFLRVGAIISAPLLWNEPKV